MLVKTGIFSGNSRVCDVGRDLFQWNRDTVLRVEGSEENFFAVFVFCEEAGLLGQVGDFEVVGQVFEDAQGAVGGEARNGDCGGDSCGNQNRGNSAHSDESEQATGHFGLRRLSGKHRL